MEYELTGIFQLRLKGCIGLTSLSLFPFCPPSPAAQKLTVITAAQHRQEVTFIQCSLSVRKHVLNFSL